MGRFATELLATDDALAALADLPVSGSTGFMHGSRPAETVVAFDNRRGTAEQRIKDGENVIKRTRLSCRRFRHNAARLQRHALAYNLGNFMRRLVLADAVEPWSLTTLREKLIKIGAKIVRHGRYVIFQIVEGAIPRDPFADSVRRIDRPRANVAPA